MNKPKEMKTRCCGAEVKVYRPVIPLGPEASPPDPIEYFDGCGRRVQLEDIIFVEEDEE